MKFTFSGVEPDAILEYNYEIEITDKFSLNDQWYIQSSLPKLYSRYAIQIPSILVKNDINWQYHPVNIKIDAPQKFKDLESGNSEKNQSYTYFWELKNVPSLVYEPNMPAYDDIAQYVILGFPKKNWNELSAIYWKLIKDRFSPENRSVIKTLAASIVGSAKDDFSKIEKIFHYIQRNYRYVAININKSGYIPNFPHEIIERKYSDCKDMTDLNVIMLKSLGIEAYPALVKTKAAGTLMPDIIQMDFNHMVAYVKDHDGREYWLDATGSSCPVNEIYPSIEGSQALVIRDDGRSFLKQLPSSESQDNILLRTVTLNLGANGDIHGHATLRLEGNENIYFRSALRDATEKDMHRVIESYMNTNTPDIQISNLQFDDPGEIVDKINIKFDFKHQSYGSMTNNLAIINTNIFSLDNNLDLFHDETRRYPLIFQAPYEIIDKVNINFNKESYSFESTDAFFEKDYTFGSLFFSTIQNGESNISFERKYKLSQTQIDPEYYGEYRDFLKNINKSNRLNLVLKKVEF